VPGSRLLSTAVSVWYTAVLKRSRSAIRASARVTGTGFLAGRLGHWSRHWHHDDPCMSLLIIGEDTDDRIGGALCDTPLGVSQSVNSFLWWPIVFYALLYELLCGLLYELLE
jgi:hypothetical protein